MPRGREEWRGERGGHEGGSELAAAAAPPPPAAAEGQGIWRIWRRRLRLQPRGGSDFARLVASGGLAAAVALLPHDGCGHFTGGGFVTLAAALAAGGWRLAATAPVGRPEQLDWLARWRSNTTRSGDGARLWYGSVGPGWDSSTAGPAQWHHHEAGRR